MKPVSIYKPVTVEQAIQILSLHGTEAGVYAGGTDLLIRLKNRLKDRCKDSAGILWDMKIRRPISILVSILAGSLMLARLTWASDTPAALDRWGAVRHGLTHHRYLDADALAAIEHRLHVCEERFDYRPGYL